MSDSKSTSALRPGLLRSSAIVTLLSVGNYAILFLLQVILAATFGADSAMDAYLAASTVPALINIVLLGAINVAIVPIFIESQSLYGAAPTWRMMKSLAILALLVLTVITTIGIVAAPTYIPLIVPGFAEQNNTLQMTIRLSQLIFPSVIFTGIAGLSAATFRANQHFTLPATAPILNGIVIISCVIALTRPFGIFSVALGTLVGSVAQFVVLSAAILRIAPGGWKIDWSNPLLRRAATLMLPWIGMALIYKGNPLVDRFFASQLPAGSVSYLGYAYRLTTMTATLLTIGITTTFFPTMSRLATDKDGEGLRNTVSLGVRLIILLLIPAIVIILLAHENIIEILFERGAFTSEDTHAVGIIWVAYIGALIGLALGNVISFAHYARTDTITPGIIAICGMVINVGMAYILTPVIGYLGPAIAYSCAALFNLAIMTALLSRRMSGIGGRQILNTTWKALTAALPTAILLRSYGQSEGLTADLSMPVRSVVSIGVLLFAVGIYGLMLHWLGVNEIRHLLSRILHRIRKFDQ